MKVKQNMSLYVLPGTKQASLAQIGLKDVKLKQSYHNYFFHIVALTSNLPIGAQSPQRQKMLPIMSVCKQREKLNNHGMRFIWLSISDEKIVGACDFA